MKRISAGIIMLAMLICSCNTKNSNTEIQSLQLEDRTSAKITTSELKEAIATTDTTKFTPPQNVPNAGSPTADWDKKIIKTADVRLELKDYNSYNIAIHKEIRNFGAYIASEEQTQNEGEIENTMSIKVPVDKFEDLMNTFSGEGIKVIQRRISTTDVTDEVVDTKGRIEAKKQAREKYLELLKKAKNMKEVLEVQNEINSLQETLEAGAGRVNYLSHQSAYSTINLTYYQYNSSSTYGEEAGFINKLKEAFRNGSTIITGFLLFVTTIWPLIIAGLAVWMLVRRWKLVAVRSSKKV